MITVEHAEEFDYIDDAIRYIKGYCGKHAECAPKGVTPCRLYDARTDGCVLLNQVIPVDWILSQESEDADF